MATLKRVFSFFIAIVLAVSINPVTVLAQDDEAGDGSLATVIEQTEGESIAQDETAGIPGASGVEPAASGEMAPSAAAAKQPVSLRAEYVEDFGGYKRDLFTIGDEVNYWNLEVWVHYSDGTYRWVNKWEYTIDPEEGYILPEGFTTVTVTYTEGGTTVTTSFDVYAWPIIKMTVHSSQFPIFYDYTEERVELPDDIYVTAYFIDGTTKILDPSQYSVRLLMRQDSYRSPFYEMDVTYTDAENGATGTWHAVSGIINIDNYTVSIVTPANKTVYQVGEYLDLTGLTIKETYIYQKSAQYPGPYSQILEPDPDGFGYFIGFRNKVTSEWIYTGELPFFDEPGEYTVELAVPRGLHLEYGYALIFREVSYDITVEAPETVLTGITITSPPSKTAYEAGETLNLTGMAVVADYSDGGKKDVTASVVTNPANGAVLSEDDTTVTVSYTENGVTMEAGFAITVTEPEVIPLTVQPGTIVQGHTSYITVKYDGSLANADFAMLDKNGGVIGSPVKGNNGVAVIAVTAPDEAGIYKIAALIGKKARGMGSIEVVAYSDNIWTAYTTVNQNGFVVINFNEDITVQSNRLTVNGQNATGVVAGGRSIVTSVRYEDLPAGSSVFSVSGVKYPKLYPAYTFTFTAAITKE